MSAAPVASADADTRDFAFSVSLVPGVGGARGYAHIGAIEELEVQGFEIRSIQGGSMGALIGGICAAGKLDAFRDWVRVPTPQRARQAAEHEPGALELFAHSLDIVQETLTRLKIEAQPPDLLISIPHNVYAFCEFDALARWSPPRAVR